MNPCIPDLFKNAKERGTFLSFSAPMVRYSRLPFRLLTNRLGTSVTYTPMILASCFVRSAEARDAELSLSREEGPLVVQFGASNAADFSKAVQMTSPWVQGIDLNCGCPQSWAIEEGLGAYWMDQTKWKDLEGVLRAGIECSSTPISVKIRVMERDEETVELARRLEAVGVSWITVHGRTKRQRYSDPINQNAIRLVKQSVSIPVVYNGDIRSIDDARRAYEETGVDGVMSARGILSNPALYSGSPVTWDMVHQCLRLGIGYGQTTPILHHHLSEMLTHLLSNAKLKHFNSLSSIPALIDFIREECK